MTNVDVIPKPIKEKNTTQQNNRQNRTHQASFVQATMILNKDKLFILGTDQIGYAQLSLQSWHYPWNKRISAIDNEGEAERRLEARMMERRKRWLLLKHQSTKQVT